MRLRLFRIRAWALISQGLCVTEDRSRLDAGIVAATVEVELLIDVAATAAGDLIVVAAELLAEDRSPLDAGINRFVAATVEVELLIDVAGTAAGDLIVVAAELLAEDRSRLDAGINRFVDIRSRLLRPSVLREGLPYPSLGLLGGQRGFGWPARTGLCHHWRACRPEGIVRFRRSCRRLTLPGRRCLSYLSGTRIIFRCRSELGG